MLQAIIVDYEELSIDYMEGLLQDIDEVNVVGKYTNGYRALSEIEELKPDLIFLAINMPEKSGLEIARDIKALLPESKIIFVTDFAEYAIEAFELGATDYVLKPLQKERLHKMIKRILNVEVDEKKQDEYSVCSFKYFHFKKNGREIKGVKWRTTKAKELFIYLIQQRHEIVRKDILIELIWPNASSDHAHENLYTSIYHIRQTLKKTGVNIEIISTQYGYELKLNDVLYDVEEWENTIEQLGAVTEETYEEFKNAMKLYKGDYLAEEAYVWKQYEQERLRVIFIFKSREIIEFLADRKKYKEAILGSMHIKNLYSYMDYSYFMLMKLYDKIEDVHSVEREYRMLQEMENNEFSTLPAKRIRTWYQEWMKRQLSK